MGSRRDSPGTRVLTPAHLHPQELQKCFDVKDVQMLQDAISKMDPTVSSRAPGPPASELTVQGKPCVCPAPALSPQYWEQCPFWVSQRAREVVSPASAQEAARPHAPLRVLSASGVAFSVSTATVPVTVGHL